MFDDLTTCEARTGKAVHFAYTGSFSFAKYSVSFSSCTIDYVFARRKHFEMIRRFIIKQYALVAVLLKFRAWTLCFDLCVFEPPPKKTF